MLLVVKWLVFLLFTSLCYADVIAPPEPGIDLTQNPDTIVWKQINTEHFNIIFSHDVEKEAQRVAHTLETVFPYVTRSLEKEPKKISLILQNQSSISNGFVTLAPWRSEWVMTPGIDPIFSNTEWLKTLSVHEFRHVVQMQKGLTGFNKFLYVLLGEYGQALGINLALPRWYFEGDAVGIETALTNGGRGRLPRFDRDLRTLLLAGKEYDYDQANLRSYKNFIPNHYVYGYFYTSKMREREGDLFLSNFSDEANDHSYNPFASYQAYKRLTGVEFEDFYKNLMEELKAKWAEKKDLIKSSPFTAYPVQDFKTWTNYEYPQPLVDGKILTLKSGLGDIKQFVLTNEAGDEEVVYYPSPVASDSALKLRMSKVAFVDVQVDARFGVRDYQTTKVLDLDSKKIIQKWEHTKWRLPVISHDGEFVAGVEWNEKQDQIIQIASIKDGGIKNSLFFPSSDVITSMDWDSSNESLFIVTKDRQDMMGIYKINISNSRIETILKPTHLTLGGINVFEDWILFESPESGIDNIFAINQHTFEKRQLTSSLTGAYAPQIFQGVLFYNEYTVDGMRIARKEGAWADSYPSSDSFVPYYESIKKYENKGSLGDKILSQASLYPVKDYNQKSSAFNLHSWMLLAPPLSSIVSAQGFSRDLLNNTTLTFGAQYDLNDHTVMGFTGINWTHYYPVFDFGMAYGGRKNEIRFNGVKKERFWEEGTAEIGMTLPWKKFTGRFLNQASLRLFDSLIKVTNKVTNDRTELADGALHAPGIQFGIQSLSLMSSRDLMAPWGASLKYHGQWAKDITGDNERGSIHSVDTRYYVPGLLKHHSFYQQVGYEKQEDKFYRFNTRIIYPRGFDNDFFKEFTKYSANYTLPLFYPDVDWDGWVFWKRITGNLFYDHLVGTPPYRAMEKNYSSYGWELMFENHYLRIPIPVNLGVRQNIRVHGPKEDFSSFQLFIQAVGQY